jgi:preprotein translocase subunit SecB
MATARKSKAEAASGLVPLKSTLLSTRLKKLSVDILLSVEESGAGQMVLSYGISASPENDIKAFPAVLKIEGKGISKDDSAKVAFTIDAEMIGLFSLSRKPSDKELQAISLDLCNYIAPVLSDTIETAMFKSGYPRMTIPKSIPK